MLEGFSACGSFVHTPCGPRKSGIPDSVEMPAPVRITMRLASSIHARTEAIGGSGELIHDLDLARVAAPRPGVRKNRTHAQRAIRSASTAPTPNNKRPSI